MLIGNSKSLATVEMNSAERGDFQKPQMTPHSAGNTVKSRTAKTLRSFGMPRSGTCPGRRPPVKVNDALQERPGPWRKWNSRSRLQFSSSRYTANRSTDSWLLEMATSVPPSPRVALPFQIVRAAAPFRGLSLVL